MKSNDEIIKEEMNRIPKSLDEITFAQFLKIKDWDGITYAELVEKLLDIDFAEALDLVDTKLEAKDFLFFDGFLEFDPNKRPKYLKIENKKIKISIDLYNDAKLGQIGELGKVYDKFEFDPKDKIQVFNEHCKHAIDICSIFLYAPFYDLEFNSDKYKVVEQKLLGCNYQKIIQLAFFLFLNYLESKSWRVGYRKILKE